MGRTGLFTEGGPEDPDEDHPDSPPLVDDEAESPDDWIAEADEEPDNIDAPDEWADYAEGDEGEDEDGDDDE